MSVFSTMPPRKLRIFAFDPSIGRRHETLGINEVIVAIPWDMDKRDPRKSFLGPVGEYIEVVDYDPSLDLFYAPVDLHDPKLLADNGLRPAEWNPQFHQQMVYAVAMNTIANFEIALGRVALWAAREHDQKGARIADEYVQRLRIYPHALREANAYYSSEKKALLFGYFEADESRSGAPPGTTVFSCLSHDIIAHETSHALLDGMHPRFNESTNPDVLALHEAFSDIVAIFQHFSYPDVLKDQISRTCGDLQSQNLLGQLAQEFGQTLGRGVALRDALGGMNKDGVWRVHEPNPKRLKQETRPHARGSILVAAVFRAFLSIYRSRIADLLRIASDGTGILLAGELHPDLVNRLAQEAAKSAKHVLQMCIRALDYCPPVDVTFGDYLRAIITADHDLYPEDEHNYRVAVIEAFLAWGIVPREMPIISVHTLLWPTMGEAAANYIATAEVLADLKGKVGYLLSRPLKMIEEMRSRPDLVNRGEKFLSRLEESAQVIADELNKAMESRLPAGAKTVRASIDEILSRNLLELGLEADRKLEWLARRLYCQLFWGLVTDPDNAHLRDVIGIKTHAAVPWTVNRSRLTEAPAVEVHSVRIAARRSYRDQIEREYVVELTQTRRGYLDREKQAAADANKGSPDARADFEFRRGCTLLIDAESFEIRRVIRTCGDVCNDAELERMRSFLHKRAASPDNAFTGRDNADIVRSEAFAHLHRHYG